jgi:DNA ligase-1
LLELPDGTRFNAGTGFSDVERDDPPPIGAIVTFRYQELSEGGVPRFPTYVGMRDDVRWKSEPRAAAAAPPRAAPAKAQPSEGRRRRFEMQDGDTRYFWEIERVGAKHRVRYGTFESKVKTFGTEAEAEAALEERISEKVGKGFTEVGED